MIQFFKNKICMALIFGLMLSLLPGCAEEESSKQDPTLETERIHATEAAMERREGIQTLLVMCLDPLAVSEDSEAYRNRNRADMFLLMVMDETAGKVTALQLNPDTMVDFVVPGTSDPQEMPLGLVFSYGSGGSDSCLNQVKAVSQLLGGIFIDHYMTFTTDSIAIVNDMFGGITVAGTEDFLKTYPEYAKEEGITLSGDTAAAFFCYRDSEDIANEAHMERQQQYMMALFSPFVECAQDDDFLTQLTLQLGDRLSTDLTLSQMAQMLESLDTYELEKTVMVIQGNASNIDGEFRFYADPDLLDQTINGLFYE